jgi:carbonic anhydrase
MDRRARGAARCGGWHPSRVRHLDDLLANNEAYAAGYAAGDLDKQPARRLAIVACMDARLHPDAFLGLREGEAHVIRNPGGVVTDAEVRALAISQILLGTHQVLVIQHTDCGMRGFDESSLLDRLEAETGTRPPWAPGRMGVLEDDVRAAVERVRSSPFIPRTDAVNGLVFDVATGRVRLVA